jgi:hypothetical protein
VALLCCHFTRNLAYYRTGFQEESPKKRDEFWVTVNGNFIDICVLEWCKLFGNNSDKHHWKQIAPDADCFKDEMLQTLGILQSDFDNCWRSIRDYRDKFVAHLDSERTMHIPGMNLAWDTVEFYYSKLKGYCSSEDVLVGLPRNLKRYYKKCSSEADGIYQE